jgi:tight adherence protein B
MPPIVILAFLIILILVLGVTFLGLTILEKKRKKRMVSVLNTLESKSNERISTKRSSIEKPAAKKSKLELLAAQFGPLAWVQSLVQQAGLSWTNSQFLGMTLACAVGGALLARLFNIGLHPALEMGVLAATGATIPLTILRFKAKRRLAAFEEQLPDALEFLARSMRAGNAFSVSLEMLGKDSPDPLGVEIRRVYNEQNLGATLDVALRAMTRRVPLVDVRFFVSAVLLQRETGGNLSEILTNLAYVIRERFKLKGMVRALSSQARFTAWVLTAIPICLAAVLMFIAPTYLDSMIQDPEGKLVLISVCVMVVVAYFIMDRIIDIKV